jgi:hypothetical protein
VAAGWVGRAAGPILAPAGPDLVHRQARAQLYFLRGQARQRARNWALARDDYRAAVQALPGWIDAWEKFGLAAAQAGPVARPETWADVWRWAPADPAAPRRWLAEARILAAARTAAQAAGEPGLAREWEGRAIARVAEALCRCPTEADRRELRQEIAADPQLAPLRGNRRFEDLAPPGRK